MRRLIPALILAAVTACVAPAAEPSSSTGPPEPEAGTPAATLAPSPSAARPTGPGSVGAVKDAGVLYVFGPDDGIYRYDGATGLVERVWRTASPLRQTDDGVYVLGMHGGVTFLRWDGVTVPIECGKGQWASVAANGACASAAGAVGEHALWVRLPGEARARLVLPGEWGALYAAWSPDASRLALVRLVRARPGPGNDPGESALWILEADGALRELYHPRPLGILMRPQWSPGGERILVWRTDTTSNSLAADGVGTSLLLLDVGSGQLTDLTGPRGILGIDAWARWSADGRLAFVRGGGRAAWDGKQVVVRAPDGRERVLRAPRAGEQSGIAPAWDARSGRIAWITGPSSSDLSGIPYVDGVAYGDRSVAIDDGALPFEVRCPEGRVAEGVRWAADGKALLLLCRRVGRDAYPFELWLHRLDGTRAALLSGVAGNPESGGFGYYGQQPSLFRVVAWSRAVR